ncbi:MAG: DedA family protein [Candidatus Norongarragalinales archaeon]
MVSLSEIEGFFFEILKPVVVAYGGVGIAFAMFLESSILPVPSELILITAGLFFDPITVAFWGTIGSTLGAMVGYYIGFKGGRPVVDKLGAYLFMTPERVMKMERKFGEWGSHAVLIGRLFPFVPFKVFSITSGILRFNFENFVVMTFIGTLPRAFLLAWLGNALLQYRSQFWIAAATLVLLAAVAYFVKKAVEKRGASKH